MLGKLAIRASSYSRLLRLKTIVRIRWLAIICQTVTLLFVALYLGFSFPLVPCLVLVIVSTWINIFLTFYYSLNHRMTPASTMVILGVDILLLSGLLYFTGGLQNPFAVLLIAPVGLGAASLESCSIILLNLLVISVVSVLVFLHEPLPWYPGTSIHLPPLVMDGIWVAIVASLIFTTVYSYRLAEEARQLADALTATELVLQQEQYLSALDGGWLPLPLMSLARRLSPFRSLSGNFSISLARRLAFVIIWSFSSARPGAAGIFCRSSPALRQKRAGRRQIFR